jgi:hypothetical protein
MTAKRFILCTILFMAVVTASYAQDTTATKSDTAVIEGKYYGFGMGLSLGAIPLFSTWKIALLDSLSRIDITPSFGRDSATNNLGDLKHNVIEAPEEFNFFIPLHISLYSVKENRSASLGLSFFSNVKQFQAEIVPTLDTGGRLVNIYETMKFYSLALEASWQMAIPPEYFSITGSQKTFVSLTLGLSPVQYISRDGDVRVTNGDTRMQSVADTVKKKMMPDFSANGASASWRVGIGTLKSLQNGSALEMGLYYSGAYSGYFFRDGKKVMKSDIHIGEDETDNPLSFISNRIEFKVTYLIPVKREKQKNQEEPVPQDGGKDIEGQQDDKGLPEQQLQQANMNDSKGQQDNPNDSENQPEQQFDSEEQQVQPEEAQTNE